jgi:SAM-dependent methyltransferase
MNGHTYRGTELDVFACAENWKHYYRAHIAEYLHGDVLEVGAGIGGTTRLLCRPSARSWLCLEPDPRLVGQLRASLAREPLPLEPEVQVGSLADLDASRTFDCILYVDVLEHVHDDRGELARAASRLRPRGVVVILAPAHNFLFSEFDRQVGHYRRYNAAMLLTIQPPGLRAVKLVYLDVAGMLLSLANRWLLRRGSPTRAQICCWDRVIIPCSRWLDPCLGRRVGKTILVVWERSDVRVPR